MNPIKILSSMIVTLVIMSCGESRKKEIDSNVELVTNPFATDWDNFREAVTNSRVIDWNNFVEIEGHLGEDYAYLFDNEEAKAKLRETSYQDLYEATLFDLPVKQLTIGVFDDNKIPEGHIFYFKETERGLKLVGFENL
jgi:hypothetical protein